MIAATLTKIAAQLRQMADDAEQPEHKVDTFDLRHVPRQIEAQAEMLVGGLVE